MNYECDACGYRTPKWMGFCPQCRAATGLREVRAGRPDEAIAVLLDGAGGGGTDRFATGIGEFDRVLGGGIVPGTALLVGGEPGVGKSTLLLQVAAGLAVAGPVLVATAEESADQVALRADRIGIHAGELYLVAAKDIGEVIAAARRLGPRLVVLDSIQAVRSADVDGAPGGVTQVRACADQLIGFAKESGIPVAVVGHVTKDGSIAGPKHLEHMVDVVLYLEGEDADGLRLLRGLKNRFGAVSEVGLFEMHDDGLHPAADPSATAAGGWTGGVPGTIAFPMVEGRRSLIVEVQALVAETRSSQPRRSVKGIDAARIHQILAVLDRHVGLGFGSLDVYVGVVGGIRVREPAADLPVAVALASSVLNRPAGRTAAWGEVGLTGEIRPVSLAERRRKEA